MADISSQPVTNFGPMLTSFGAGVADQNLTKAEIANMQQDVQAKTIANMRAQAMLPLYLRAVANFQGQEDQQADQSGVATPADGASLHKDAPQMIDQHLRNQFFVDPTGTPQERQAVLSASITGDPGLVAFATNQRDQNVKSRVAQSAKQANDLYDEMSSVATAQDNGATALQTLRAVAPNTAKQIEKQFTDPDAAERAAKDYATHVASAAHQYTGRPVKADNAGVLRDEVTGLPVIGTPGVGLSAKDWSDLASKGSEITTVTRGGKETQVPRWEADKSPSLASWVQQQAAGGTPGAAPATPTAAAIHAAKMAQIVAPGGAGAGTPPQPAPPPTTAQSAKMGPLTGAQIDFVKDGPKAPSFLNTGESKPSPADVKNQTEYAADRREMLDTANSDMQKAQSTLVSVGRAQAILATNPTLGPGSGALASIKTVVANWTPGHAADVIEQSAAMRQLLGKELGQDQLNSMLSKLHGEGASVRLGAQESGLILNALSASPELSKPAIQQMLDWEKSDAQYAINKARTARAWVNAGNDVQKFNYEEQFPRPVNTQTTLVAKQMPAAPKLAAYAAKYFGGNVDEARKYLASQGHK